MKIHYKKSQEAMSNWPFWIVFTMAVAGVGLAIVKISNVNVEDAAKIPYGVEDELILASRFYNSEDCFAYEDEVGRVYSQSIDVSKFTQENMDLGLCFSRSRIKYAFSLSLKVIDFSNPPLVSSELGPINTFGWTGESASKAIIEDVLVFQGGSKHKGKLTIAVKNVR